MRSRLVQAACSMYNCPHSEGPSPALPPRPQALIVCSAGFFAFVLW